VPPAPHRLAWRAATLLAAGRESATARTLLFEVPGWPGHLAGQHVIVRLTATGGYSAQRSYSIASAPPAGDRVELTVQRLEDGEVSPYLADVIEPGDQVEIRGPIGGWFVWDHDSAAPVQLIAGGSGIVPLMSMVRAASGTVPIRLLYSARTPADVIYPGELARRAQAGSLAVTYLFTRAGQQPPSAPAGTRGAATLAASATAVTSAAPVALHGRIRADVVADVTWSPRDNPAIFICGPSGFVGAAASLLIAAGHAPSTIKTERFGPTS
jgi:ferredoxin-NADP reductase